jgi:molybdate-binding protein/DNA-binding transcriptional regulator YhcF (GntR family)
MSHLYQEIAESIRRRIATGDLPPGSRLPAVRELAEQWRCTPSTVNRAYRELAEEGLTGAHRGSGTWVLDSGLLGRGLITSRPELQWAGLVHRAEQYLLEALNAGHTSLQAQSALTMAVARWQALQSGPPTGNGRPADPKPFRFAGSHDLTVELLAEMVEGGPPNRPVSRMSIEFVGSLGGLIALARGEADIAGSHLWDAATASYNLPFIHRVLPNRSLALVTLVQRQLGLIVPPGNPQQLTGLAELSRPGLRWINRQAGSGTRIWLDEQLKRIGLRPEQIEGYDQEATTHMNLAQAIDDGRATAGLGIMAAAAAYGLAFVPLTEELYQLVVPAESWDRPVWQAMLAVIRSGPFAARVNDLGGYGTGATGEVTWL